MATELKLKIQGRELPFPQVDTMTFREAKLVKDVSGLRLGEFADALEAGDIDMLLAMAAVAKVRADGALDVEALRDLRIEEIEVLEEEVEDPSPPAPKGKASKAEPAEAPEDEPAAG